MSLRLRLRQVFALRRVPDASRRTAGSCFISTPLIEKRLCLIFGVLARVVQPGASPVVVIFGIRHVHGGPHQRDDEDRGSTPSLDFTLLPMWPPTRLFWPSIEQRAVWRVLGERGLPLEQAAAQVCREAGASEDEHLCL